MQDGKISRNDKIRLIRDGIVIQEGEIGSLKRFKEDVKEDLLKRILLLQLHHK